MVLPILPETSDALHPHLKPTQVPRARWKARKEHLHSVILLVRVQRQLRLLLRVESYA